MNKTVTLLGFLLALSCSSLLAQVLPIDTVKSSINWKGAKVTGEHTGSIKFKSGKMEFKKDKLIGGSFIVDMSSLDNDDLSGRFKNRLVKHLKSDDFFGVEQFPTASLDITEIKSTGINQYSAQADLTIKGITHPIEFTIDMEDNLAKADLLIDRSKYDIRYRSKSFFKDLGDKMIYDQFEINVMAIY